MNYNLFMKILFILLATAFICANSLTNKEILQQALNGLFQENKLPDPTTIIPCIDETTAGKIVVFIGKVLGQAAKGSIADIIRIIGQVKAFGDEIPQSVKDCLDGNKEFEVLGLKYGIDNNTDSSAIEKKIAQYVTLHYLTVHKWLGSLDSLWNSAKYYQVGFDAATYGHSVFKMTGGPLALTNKEILQQALNGLFQENKLPDPTTIIPCIDETTAGKIVVFIGKVLGQAAKGSIADIIRIIGQVKAFGDEIPQSVKDCLDGNKEFEVLGLKYGIDNNTDSSAIEKKIAQYVTLHYLTVHKWLGSLDSLWNSAKYYQVGFDAATYGHSVFKMTGGPLALTNKEILQQALNGGFTQNGLANPTTIVPCIDEDTAGLIVQFIGSSLQKAARGNVNDLISLVTQVKNFGDKIPQPVKDCLDGNQQFKALGLKYGVDDTTDSSTIQKKIIAYITFHYLQVHGWLGSLNSEWATGKYYQTGFDACTYGHSILKITPEDIRKLIEA